MFRKNTYRGAQGDDEDSKVQNLSQEEAVVDTQKKNRFIGQIPLTPKVDANNQEVIEQTDHP